jgi:dTMP kinase
MINLTENNYTGKLIVFEGTDGAGKTTLINMTAEYLARKLGNENILLTKQPTDISRKTKLFQKMMYCSNHDEINYRAVQLLTLSDRIQHNYEEIVPALKSGKTVICDRYIYTSVANMLARGYRNEDWFFDACKEIIKPDITFLAYVEPEIAIKRIKARTEECNRHLNERLLKNVAKEFLYLSASDDLKVLQTMFEPEKTFIRVKEYLNAMIYGGLTWKEVI